MNDLRLDLLGRVPARHQQTTKFFRAVLDRPMQHARLHRTADARRPKRSRVTRRTARTTTTSPTVSSCSRDKELSTTHGVRDVS